jgi:predicted TPR repeat methyltransferase
VTSIPIQDFEERYAEDPDPWGFSSRWYEARKYALTLAALPRRHYQRVFEPGCSIGVLSAQLADRCDYLLAADGVEAALEQARARLEARGNVELARLVLPHQWPDGPWDLVVVSEVGYYFSTEDLAVLLDRAAHTMVAEATLVAVHWRGTTNYPLTGDAVHQTIDGHRAFEHHGGYCETRFRLDVYRRRPE